MILSEFAERTGFEVQDLGEFTIQRHASLPWMGATLDGFVEDTPDGPAVVEAKNVSQVNAADWSGEEPPLRTNVQVQHQMECCGARVAYVVGLIGGNRLTWKKVGRNQRFIDAMLPLLAAFWELVEKGIPPPVDGSGATRRILDALYPEDNGAAEALPPESDQWDDKLVRAKGRVKRLGTLIDYYENELRAAIAGATYGRTPAGVEYSLKTQTRAAHHVKESTFRVLRRCK